MHQNVCSPINPVLYLIVDSRLIVDTACNQCMKDIQARCKPRVCVICGKGFCSDCVRAQSIHLPSFKPFTNVSSCNTCSKFLLRIQLELDRWYNCAPASKQLSELEARVTSEHTQLCARMSNFEGLVRFFLENKDKIPRADLIGPLPEIEKSVRAGISNLGSLQREINSVECSPHHQDEIIRKCLSNFVAYHVARIKSQFSVSSKLYERLINTRGFSPSSHPSSPPFRFAPSRSSTPPAIDLDSV